MNAFFYDSFELILFFLVPGILYGCAYDVIRILRIARTDSRGKIIPKLAVHFKISYIPRLQREKRKERLELIFVFVEDILFCVFATLGELLLFYHLNDGVVRFWGILLSVGGFFLYRISFGLIVIFMAKRIIYGLRSILYLVLVIAFTPLMFFVRLGKRIFHPRKGLSKRKDVYDG